MTVDVSKNFKEHSIAEFFKKNRQMLGYSGKIKSLTTAIHEYVTNALDACEESGILPEIFIEIKKMGPEKIKLTVEDNGPGIPKKFIGKAFATMLAGTKFHRFIQQRGQQGIGGTGVVMFGQITTGKPSKIVSSDGNGTIYECDISIDVKINRPHITNEKSYPGQMRGTRATTEIGGVKYQKGAYSPDEYIRRTALANPHCKFVYINPDGETIVYDRAVEKIPKLPKETKPHPKGIEVDDLLTMASATKSRRISSFLTTDFTRMSSGKVAEIAKEVSVDLNKQPKRINWEEAEEIVKAIKKTKFVAPPTDCLIPINEEHLKRALENILQPEFENIITRTPAIYRGGVPFIIEVALAYGGKSGKNLENGEGTNIEIMRFANRVPLLFDAGACGITKAINSVEWKRYGIKAENPVTILVNFTSIYVPYTGAGKESISDEEDIIKEIKLALMEAARKVGSYISGQRRKSDQERKKKTFEKYTPETAKAVSALSGVNEKLLEQKLIKIVNEKYAELFEDEDEELEEEETLKDEEEENKKEEVNGNENE